jgi:UPF0755 protein
MRKWILGAVMLLFFVVGWVGYRYYQAYFQPNVPVQLAQTYVQIPQVATFEQVRDSLFQHNQILDTVSFREVANRLDYIRTPMRSGRFEIKPNWTNLDLVRHLRAGAQATVNVILTNERLVEEVAGKVAQFIDPDSLELLTTFLNPTHLAEYDYTEATLMALFIPNTYEFYWNTSPVGFMARMQKENARFWLTNNRLEKAKRMGYSPTEIYTLASIVEKETNQNSEKARIAGVYLNRLKKGMLLQADPTAVFATRDFTTKRVTFYHTKFDSPYNTYMYTGLPPGPISMASISSIDAVLNAEAHDYLYFCAKGDGSGLHSFAKTLAGHNQNVAVYRRNLRQGR